MKNRPALFAGLAAGLFAAAAGIAPGQAASKQAASKAERPAALIRRDLLAAPRPEPAASRRDLFLPGAATPVAADAGRPTPAGSGSAPGAIPGTLGAASAAQSADDLQIRYVGYVQSDRGTIALVIIDSLPLAVAEGEDVRPGWRIAKIAPDRLEVAGPDGVLKPVLREGELP
jgi:hypothetical protein